MRRVILLAGSGLTMLMLVPSGGCTRTGTGSKDVILLEAGET